MTFRLGNGDWFVARAGTVMPEHTVSNGRFIDAWPAGWRPLSGCEAVTATVWVTSTTSPVTSARQTTDVAHVTVSVHCSLTLSRPIPGLLLTVPAMLAWQSIYGDERMIAPLATMISSTHIALLLPDDGRPPFTQYVIGLRDET